MFHAVYSADGEKLVTSGRDSTVRIWNAATGTLFRTLVRDRHGGRSWRYYRMAMSPDDKLVAAIDSSEDFAVTHVWDACTGALLAELPNGASHEPSLAFSADSRWLATSGGDDVRVFDTSSWMQVLKLGGPLALTLSFAPTGSHLVTSTFGGDASLWAIPSGKRIVHLREFGEPIDTVAFSRDGKLIVTGSRDGAEQVWNAESGRLLSQINYLRSKIQSVEFDASCHRGM